MEISSEEMIEKAYGADHVLYACVQGMDAGKDGNEVTYKNMGYITIGNKDRSHDEKLKAVTELFDRTGLAYKVPDDILREQWNKLMLNTGVNQVTAVYGAPYSLIQKEGEARTMMIEAMPGRFSVWRTPRTLILRRRTSITGWSFLRP